jgi:hypothetical protein
MAYSCAARCVTIRRPEHVPIVIVTGQGRPQATAAIEAGCNAVLETPCSPALPVETIKVLLLRRPIEDRQAERALIENFGRRVSAKRAMPRIHEHDGVRRTASATLPGRVILPSRL